MFDEVKVSVCCLAYNHERYIREALESFVGQKTDFRYEILVNDDVSTDGTRKIIDEYVQKYPDLVIPIYQTENQYSKGVNVLETFFAGRCRGKYIAFCEGDDCWTTSDKLQKQVEFLDYHMDYSSCVHNTKIVNLYKKTSALINKSQFEYDFEMEELINWNLNLFHFSSVVIRAELLNNLPTYYKICSESGDYPLALFMRVTGKIHYFPQEMSEYRYGVQDSFSRKMKDSKEIIRNLDKQIAMLREFNQCTDNEYQNETEYQILCIEFEIKKMQGDFKQLLNKKYKKILMSLQWKSKIAFGIGLMSPSLYKCLVNVK